MLRRREGSECSVVEGQFSKISKDPKQLAQHYNIIVVGSGLSASITAVRLGQVNAKFELGLHIAVFERGEEWLPGNFPETQAELTKAIRSSRSGKVHNPLGLFETHRSPDIDAILACGLGGSTLINTGIFTPPDPRIFEQEGWPDALRHDIELGRLDKYFKRAESVIKKSPSAFSRPNVAL